MPAIKRKPIEVAENAPYLPPPVTQELVWSLKGLVGGEADKGQQTMAMQWIIYTLCKTYELPYFPGLDGARDGDFAKGKMFCGQQIVKLVNMPLDMVTKLPRLSARSDEDDGSIQNK